MNLGHLAEALMLVCFGFSWPLNVVKAYRAGTTKGTSLAFIFLIIAGYLAGISAKFINGQFNYVLAVYFLNLVIVMGNLFVYFRNLNLDKKKERESTKIKFLELRHQFKNSGTKEENMNYQELNSIAKKGNVVLFGGSLDKEIPVAELAQSFEINTEIYNRSQKGISIKNAKKVYKENISAIEPAALIIHIGDNDTSFFRTNKDAFDSNYLSLLESIKKENPNMAIALVSVNNPKKDSVIDEMNRHIRLLADSEKCLFVNLENAKLWNPKATKESLDFARAMGLKAKRPLKNIAEILYSYAYVELDEESKMAANESEMEAI